MHDHFVNGGSAANANQLYSEIYVAPDGKSDFFCSFPQSACFYVLTVRILRMSLLAGA